MEPSKACYDLIKKWEGCQLTAYLCPASRATIGWGSIWHKDAGRSVRLGDTITQEQADRWLEAEVAECARGVSRIVKIPISQAQFNALVSFSYNLGVGALEKSTLLRELNAGDFEGAAQEFHRWVKADTDGDGVADDVLLGLKRRRADEEAMFRAGMSKGEVYLVCRRTGRKNSLRQEVLELSVVNGAGEKWLVHSGAPGERQVFQKGGSSNIPGSLYPCPQGEYDIDSIEWAGGKDNWSASHGPGLGPVFVPFNPRFSTRRGSFGFHLDSNRESSPGSAGCIVFDTLVMVRAFVAMLRKYDPKKLVVDWGL